MTTIRFTLGIISGIALVTAIQACCFRPPQAFMKRGEYSRADAIEAHDVAEGATLTVDDEQVVLQYVSIETGEDVTVMFEVVEKDIPGGT